MCHYLVDFTVQIKYVSNYVNTDLYVMLSYSQYLIIKMSLNFRATISRASIPPARRHHRVYVVCDGGEGECDRLHRALLRPGRNHYPHEEGNSDLIHDNT